jgi:ribosomal protein L40E
MGFFSDLGRKTSETTGKIARETKLKMKINENKGKITDIYEEIGKKVYEKHVREENIDIKADLEEECKKLDELSKEIEEARIEILKLNQKKLCSKCSAEIENGALFCPKCGEKQEQEPTKKEEALEKLEEANIEPEKKEEAEAVKEDLKEEVKEEKSEE